MAIGIKILVVDDEPDFVMELQATLQSRGYSVITARERVQAQGKARSEKPDMVILGTMMPRGDAFVLHQWLKRTPELSEPPILVVDASPEKHLLKGWKREEGMQLEAEDYLRKPVDPEALMPRIEKLLDKVTRRTKVLVVDDHAIIRDGICAVLSLQKDIQVVGEAIDGKEALEKTRDLLPDVVLMDIVMPGINGLEATKQICREYKEVKVLILTQYDDEENLLASTQVGAWGFIPKKSASSQLLAGIRCVSQGKRYLESVPA